MFFLLRDNKQTGPFTVEELRQKGLKPYDLVWLEGKSAAWRYPGEIPELKEFAPAAEEQPFDRFYKHPLREKPSYTSSQTPAPSPDTSDSPKKEEYSNKPEHVPAKLYVEDKPGISREPGEKIRKEIQLKRKSLTEQQPPRDNASVFKEALQQTRNNRPSNIAHEFEQDGFPPAGKILKETAVIKVIIADDHSLFRAGVKTALAHRRDVHLVGEAENGKQLLTMLRHLEPDVILLDIQMPIMDGLATLPEIRKLYPSVKIVVLSMHNDQSMIAKMMEIGANSYLTKSADSTTIYQAIKTCYEEEYFFNDTTNKALLTSLRSKNSAPPAQITPVQNAPEPVPSFAEDIISPVQRTSVNDRPKKRVPVLSIIVGLALTGALVFAGISIRQNNTAAIPTKENTKPDSVVEPENIPQQVLLPDSVPAQSTNPIIDSALQSKDSVGTAVKTNMQVTTAKEKKSKEIVDQPISKTVSVPAKDTSSTTQQEVKVTAPAITEKELFKPNLFSQVSVSANKYRKEAFGGIAEVQLTVTNHSKQNIAQLTVEIQYLLANDKIFKTEQLIYKNIPAGEAATQQAPNSTRGVKINYKITQVN